MAIDRTKLRQIIRDLEGTKVDGVSAIIKRLKAIGAVRNIHLGRTDLNADETAEWYAGQALDVLESEGWFAVNSLINCCDKFAPAVEP